MASKHKTNGALGGRPWIKPTQDPVVHDIAFMVKNLMETSGVKAKDLHRKTSLSRSTIYNLLSKKTKQPQASTVRLLARACGMEPTFKKLGSNK